MTNRDYNPNDLEREATQNMHIVPRKIQGLEGFRVAPGERIWEQEEVVNGKVKKIRIRVQSLVDERFNDQGALEAGEEGESYDSGQHYQSAEEEKEYVLPKRRIW